MQLKFNGISAMKYTPIKVMYAANVYRQMTDELMFNVHAFLEGHKN